MVVIQKSLRTPAVHNKKSFVILWLIFLAIQMLISLLDRFFQDFDQFQRENSKPVDIKNLVFKEFPAVTNFFRKLFSPEIKRKIRDSITEINSLNNVLQSSIKYFSTANLLIHTKLMLKWEEETFKVLQHLSVSLGSDWNSGFGHLMQIADLTGRKKLFRLLGYGQLFDNIPFLEEMTKECKLNQNAEKFSEQLFENIAIRNSLKSQYCSSYVEIGLNPSQVVMTLDWITLGQLDKQFLYKMQQVALMIIGNSRLFWDPTCQDLNLLDISLSLKINHSGFVEEFLDKFIRSKSKTDFVSNIFFPDIDSRLFDLKVDDLEKCRQCNWRFWPIEVEQK
jgi:hypothetical protein